MHCLQDFTRHDQLSKLQQLAADLGMVTSVSSQVLQQLEGWVCSADAFNEAGVC